MDLKFHDCANFIVGLSLEFVSLSHSLFSLSLSLSPSLTRWFDSQNINHFDLFGDMSTPPSMPPSPANTLDPSRCSRQQQHTPAELYAPFSPTSVPSGYMTMGPVQAAQWAQQPFSAQAQTLAFPVQGPLQVAQVLPGGQPVIWSQANIFPATQQQWAAMAAYMPAQTVGVGGHAIPAAMLQGLVPITTMCPQACDISAPSSAITSPQHTADPGLLQRQLSLGRDCLGMDSDAGEGPSTSGARSAGVGPGVASAAVSRCGTPGPMGVPDTLDCSQLLLPPSAAANQEEEGSCSDLDLSRMTLSPGTSTSPSTESPSTPAPQQSLSSDCPPSKASDPPTDHSPGEPVGDGSNVKEGQSGSVVARSISPVPSGAPDPPQGDRNSQGQDRSSRERDEERMRDYEQQHLSSWITQTCSVF
ncbi:hypothetical protein FQN60_016268 [Etheostoma spectabile]|uniref:Disabled homolog 1b n=1 Tax=Etheostoma spectabile TaxID=54343 RepID=A0A5J5D3Z1_9PERO|nr:hypothetical protein FQN60_016268 [Etheostoma spectabile]